MNRQKLAKTLWNGCDEPIGVALICSRMYKELSRYTMEQYRRTELEENAKYVVNFACGFLNNQSWFIDLRLYIVANGCPYMECFLRAVNFC